MHSNGRNSKRRHDTSLLSYEERSSFNRIMEEEDFSTIEKKVLSVTDGFDAVPRPTGFDNSDEQIPPGHIVYQGDFEPPLDQA